MKNRKGQAILVVVIIMAVVMAVFANSLTTGVRSHSLTETEVYQREQALYLAETGVNRMIFNINNGTTYSDGDSINAAIPGIGSYKTIYHTPDNSGYGGDAYIESTGIVGQFSRKIFVSVQSGGGNKDAFKYCLFTKAGGRDGIADDSYFTNYVYGDNFLYNHNSVPALPFPDLNYYNENYAEKLVIENGDNPTYKVKEEDLGKVIYIHTSNSNANLTVSFVDIYDESYSLSFITDAKNVKFTKMGPANGDDTDWSGAENSKDNNLVYPILVHLGTGTVTFKFDYSYDDNTTLNLRGFIYTSGNVKMEYDLEWEWFWGYYYTDSFGAIYGELMENNPQGDLGGILGDGTRMYYITDYYTAPPPHFIIPGNKTKGFPGSFREEY